MNKNTVKWSLCGIAGLLVVMGLCFAWRWPRECIDGNGAIASKDASRMEKIVSGIIGWLKPHQTNRFSVEDDGKDVYIRGVVGGFPTLFNKYDIVVNLDTESREAVCYGYLPTKVPEERKAEMIELLFRAE